MNMVRLRLISMSLAALICVSIVYIAVSHKFRAISEMFEDLQAIKVEVEKKPPPPPPPPPPKERPPPPPPPLTQRVPPPDITAPPTPTELPVAPPAPPAPVAPSVITNPQWVERPSGREFTRFYPQRAIDRERTGRVVLDCVVGADGRIGCTVSSEDPAGWGFGEAAVRISHYFRMSPRLEDGRPTEGGRVRVPIVFNLGE